MRRDKDIIGYLYNDTEQKIREQIAKEIEALIHEDGCDGEMDCQQENACYRDAAAIARGNNAGI